MNDIRYVEEKYDEIDNYNDYNEEEIVTQST